MENCTSQHWVVCGQHTLQLSQLTQQCSVSMTTWLSRYQNVSPSRTLDNEGGGGDNRNSNHH